MSLLDDLKRTESELRRFAASLYLLRQEYDGQASLVVLNAIEGAASVLDLGASRVHAAIVYLAPEKYRVPDDAPAPASLSDIGGLMATDIYPRPEDGPGKGAEDE